MISSTLVIGNLIAAAFIVSFLIFVAWWRQWRALFVVGVILGGVWLYQAQWYGRALVNVRWIDDKRVQYQNDSIITAIRAGKIHIPLVETTDFKWTAVCRLGGYQRYVTQDGGRVSEESRILRDALGTDFIPEIEDTLWGHEAYLLVYATPAGPYVMKPTWGRFGREFQSLLRGRYYQNALEGKGYWVFVKTKETTTYDWKGLCFKPDDIGLETQVEP